MRRPQRLLLILMLISTGCANNSLPRGTSDPQTIVLRLSRGNFPVLVYEPKGEIKGTLLFGSGDGGWKIWEERACRSLALDGWRVIGWDCRQYASDRFVPYGAQILGRDLQTMVSVGIGGRSQGKPVFYGGYSTGAEQAVSGSAWMLSRQGASECLPRGLLLVAPGERGRYGITEADLIGMTPHGVGSFGLADLASSLGQIPIAQIHGTLDPLDSTKWFEGSGKNQIHHRIIMIQGNGHFFGNADEFFQVEVCKAADWLLQCSQASFSSSKRNCP